MTVRLRRCTILPETERIIDIQYKTDILTDMRKILVTLDDELDKVLARAPNQNELIRKAVRLYTSDITPDTLEGLRAGYTILVHSLNDLHTKFDYIVSKLQ